MRVLATAVLLALAAVAGLLAWGSLQNLWEEQPDSEAGTYLLIGIPSLAVTVAALYCVVRLWRAG